MITEGTIDSLFLDNVDLAGTDVLKNTNYNNVQ